MKTMSEFFHMGGYGAFVWSAYGVWVLVMLWNVLAPWWRHRRLAASLKREIRAEVLEQASKEASP